MTGNNDFYKREGVDLNVQHAKVYSFYQRDRNTVLKLP